VPRSGTTGPGRWTGLRDGTGQPGRGGVPGCGTGRDRTTGPGRWTRPCAEWDHRAGELDQAVPRSGTTGPGGVECTIVENISLIWLYLRGIKSTTFPRSWAQRPGLARLFAGCRLITRLYPPTQDGGPAPCWTASRAAREGRRLLPEGMRVTPRATNGRRAVKQRKPALLLADQSPPSPCPR